MSIPVDLDRLADTLADYRFAYLLTTGEDLRPHAVMATPQLRDGRLHVAGAGRRTRANAQARPAIALIWPPEQDTGYSLIVDGDAVVDGEVLAVTPRRAVLHRPATPDATSAPDACESDCLDLGASTPAT